jgi:integrase/recombinase XerD
MRSKYIKVSDVDRLRKAVGSEEWLPLEVSLETGLRIGDVVALKCIQIARDDDGYYIRYIAAKTHKEGVARVSDSLGRRLEAISGRGKYMFPPAKRYSKTPHLTRQACWYRMKAAARRLGIDEAGVSPHSLRKNFAVALRHERGLQAVREALQHSSDAVTRIYAYADTVLKAESDEPILWRDLELIVDYILERIKEKSP